MNTTALTAKQVNGYGLARVMNSGDVHEIKPINGEAFTVQKFLGFEGGKIVVKDEKGKRRMCGKKSVEKIIISASSAIAKAVSSAA